MWRHGAGEWMTMLVLMVAVLALGLLLLRCVVAPPRGRAEGGAVEVLERRYAAGEIDRHEFEERMRVLGRL